MTTRPDSTHGLTVPTTLGRIPVPDAHDWEADPRPYDQVLRDWRDTHGWRLADVAAELREPPGTVKMHLDGRFPGAPDDRSKTAQRRRLMTLIDLNVKKGGRSPL